VARSSRKDPSAAKAGFAVVGGGTTSSRALTKAKPGTKKTKSPHVNMTRGVRGEGQEGSLSPRTPFGMTDRWAEC
jgi:hypothetical protein